MSESVTPPAEPESFREAYKRWAAAVDAGAVPITAADEAFIDAMLAWLDVHPDDAHPLTFSPYTP